MFIEKVVIGIVLQKVMIVIISNSKMGNMTINFSENQFEINDNLELSENIYQLIQILLETQQKYAIENIIIGYEPASDDDMKMVELYQGHMKIFNEDISQSLFAQSLYRALKR